MPDIFPDLNEDAIKVIKAEVGTYVDQIQNRSDGVTYREARDEAADDLTDRLMLYSAVDEAIR